MLLGFYDGSGSHKGSKIFSFCGFIGEEAAWTDLDSRWRGVLDNPRWPSRLTEFHTYDCVHGIEEFESWRYAERLAIYGELLGVIHDSQILALGSSVVIAHLTSLPPDDLALLESQGLGTPTDLAFQLTIQYATTKVHEYGENEQVGLIFDNEDEALAERYHALFNHYRHGYPLRQHLAGMAFVDSKKFTPIQAADVLAYTTMRLDLEKYYPAEREPWFPVLPAFLKIIEGMHIDGGGYDAEALASLILKVRSGEIVARSKDDNENSKTSG
ncbi:MAG: DUF3800 domain-containing protein [Terriglobia bacterium]|jgi:hypothetical protein